MKRFIKKYQGEKIVVVQGLGFVGSVMSLVCANAINGDYAVIGVDVPTERGKKITDDLNNGIFPLVADDPKIEELYKKSIRKGNFFATSNIEAYSYADVIIVDVNLDVDKNSEHSRGLNSYNVDLASFKKAINVIGNHCKEDVLILVETTVPPGTCKEVVMPIIYDCLMKRKFSLNKMNKFLSLDSEQANLHEVFEEPIYGEEK